MVMRVGALVTAALVAVVAGCATAPPPRIDTQPVTLASDWTVTGRLALSNGRDGGSGTLTWSQQGARGELAFVGAFGRGSWRLSTAPGQATLETADGQFHHASDVATLVLRQTGWSVPVEALAWWIRGLPQPGTEATLDRNREGELRGLLQHGWQVRFEGDLSHDGMRLPRKITADRDGNRVRLLVTQWSVDSPA